jgi:hypothetical protein
MNGNRLGGPVVDLDCPPFLSGDAPCLHYPCCAEVDVATLLGRNEDLCTENAELRERIAELEMALEREKRRR